MALRAVPEPSEPLVWLRVLGDTFSYMDEPEDVLAYFRWWIRHALTGDCSAHLMAFLHGQSGTGKNTVADALLYLFADYGQTIPAVHVVGKRDSHRSWIAQCDRKRYVMVGDLPEHGSWSTELHDMVGGADLNANFMRQNHFTFRSRAHVLATGNDAPRGRSPAAMRQSQLRPHRLGSAPDRAARARRRVPRLGAGRQYGPRRPGGREARQGRRERRRDGGRARPWADRVSDVDALRDRLIAERLAAHESGAEVLAAVARVEHFNRQRDAGARDVGALTCPDNRLPSPLDLFRWMPSVPDAAWDAVGAAEVAHGPGAVAWLSSVRDVLTAENVPLRGGIFVLEHALADCSRQWSRMPEPRPRHPGAALVDAWQAAQPVAEPMVDDDRPRIMPRAVAHIEHNAESFYLSRFGPAVHRDAGGQLLMGFAEEGERGPTLPANVWTMGLSDAEKRGAVVPLALRIWIAAVLHTPLHTRHGNYPILLNQSDGSALTLRRFLQWVYPGRPPRPNEYWPRILRAREVINATELPYADARGNLWGRQVVRLDTPYTRPGLDDPWPTIVHLPPGDGTGARVPFERLQYWWTRDAAATRALINLAYRWHIEGKRMMPAPGGKYWLQLRDPKLYDRLTDAEIEALCYPPGTGSKRRDERIADGRRALDKLVREGDARWNDGRLLPPLPSDSTGARPPPIRPPVPAPNGHSRPSLPLPLQRGGALALPAGAYAPRPSFDRPPDSERRRPE